MSDSSQQQQYQNGDFVRISNIGFLDCPGSVYFITDLFSDGEFGLAKLHGRIMNSINVYRKPLYSIGDWSDAVLGFRLSPGTTFSSRSLNENFTKINNPVELVYFLTKMMIDTKRYFKAYAETKVEVEEVE